MDAKSSFNVAAEVEKYLSTVSGAARAASDAYFEGGYWLILWGALLGVVLNWAILHFGIARRLSDWAAARSRRRWLADLIFALVYLAGTSIVLLPWAVYTGFIREHQYGLSTQSFGQWFGEWGISFLLGTIFIGLVIVMVLALVRRAPRSWWAFGAGAMMLLVAFVMIVSPVVVAPLFNDYRPMPESALKEDILSMARANGVPADNVYVVDQSRQSNRISANVQGLGPTIRVSLNDNLLNNRTPAEVRAVMGHELGHYVLNHGPKMLTALSLLVLVLFGYLAWVGGAIVQRKGADWGIASLGDRTVVPLAFLLIEVFFFAATPVTNTLIRVNEQEADIFGVNAAREPDAFASVAMALSTYRKLDPGPWEEAIFFDHPSGRTRVETVMRWKAEHLGEGGADTAGTGTGGDMPSYEGP